MIQCYEFEVIHKQAERRVEYWFVTHNNIVYYGYFVELPEYLGEEIPAYDYLNQHGHVFGFCPQDEDQEIPHDYLVGVTICEILKNYFSKYEKAIILYHCDALDGQQLARDILFSRWARNYASGVAVHKNSVKVEVKQPGKPDRIEYLGYYAMCPTSELHKVDVEFKNFAAEKANSDKDNTTDVSLSIR